MLRTSNIATVFRWAPHPRGVLALLFWAGLCLPLFQQLTHLPRDVRLAGVENRAEVPRLTWRTWFSGEFGRAFPSWFEQRIGLRGWLVKSGNQAGYAIFRRTVRSANQNVVIGRDHWLYERIYVQHYLRRIGIRDAARDDFVRALAGLDRALAARGRDLVVVVAPSKVEIHPEHLPPDMQLDRRQAVGQTNAYEALLPALRAEGVRVVDGHQLFMDAKADHPPLFASGGTHWNGYGAQLTVQALFELLRSRPNSPELPLPRVAGAEWGPAEGTDLDLRRLLNLWWFEPGGPPAVPYPRLSIESPAPAGAMPVPRVLIVGDSFSFQFVDALAQPRLVGEVEMFYYFKRRFIYNLADARDSASRTLNHIRADRGPMVQDPAWLARHLEAASLVLLVVNEIQLRDCGWGFPAAALAALTPPAPATGSAPPSAD